MHEFGYGLSKKLTFHFYTSISSIPNLPSWHSFIPAALLTLMLIGRRYWQMRP